MTMNHSQDPSASKNDIMISDELSPAEMTQIAQEGGAFEWLQDEPDIYSDEHGEPA